MNDGDDLSKNDDDHKCSEHQGLAISCAKINEIHENVLYLRQELKEGMDKAFEMENQIIALKTSKEERWKMQGYFNKTIAGGFIAMAIFMAEEYFKR